jgi:hypothetical protein
VSGSCLGVNAIHVLYMQQFSLDHVATGSLSEIGQCVDASALCASQLYSLSHYSAYLNNPSSLLSHLSSLTSSSSLLITHHISISSLICSTRSVFPEPFNPLMDERETLDRNSDKSLSDYKSKNFYIWRVPCEYSAQLHRYGCV